MEALPETGLTSKISYPVIHFLITLANDIPEEFADRIKVSLSDLNLVISSGAYPTFGCFCYEPSLRQIFLNYRLPVNPGAADSELTNIRYYFGVLYEALDLLADLILYLCDNEGKMPDLPSFLKYLKEISDITDMEERVEEMKKILEEVKDL